MGKQFSWQIGATSGYSSNIIPTYRVDALRNGRRTGDFRSSDDWRQRDMAIVLAPTSENICYLMRNRAPPFKA